MGHSADLVNAGVDLPAARKLTMANLSILAVSPAA